MGLVVKQLRMWVRVKPKRRTNSPMGKDADAPRPALLYAMPNAQTALQTDPLPTQTVEGAREADLYQGESPLTRRPDPRRVDPTRVAERVYELMSEELRLARLRSGRA